MSNRIWYEMSKLLFQVIVLKKRESTMEWEVAIGTVTLLTTFQLRPMARSYLFIGQWQTRRRSMHRRFKWNFVHGNNSRKNCYNVENYQYSLELSDTFRQFKSSKIDYCLNLIILCNSGNNNYFHIVYENWFPFIHYIIINRKAFYSPVCVYTFIRKISLR